MRIRFGGAFRAIGDRNCALGHSKNNCVAAEPQDEKEEDPSDTAIRLPGRA